MANQEKILKVAEWLEKQALDSDIKDDTICHNLSLNRRTFYRLKPKAVEIVTRRSKERQKTIEQVNISAAVEAAKSGLKSKAERVMILQDQVDSCLDDLTKKKLTVFEKVALRKALKELQSEISKIEGDYAPTKQAQTDKDGNDVEPAKPYSKEELMLFLKSANG